MALRSVAVALLAVLTSAPVAAQRGLEYEVKAAYLYNIVNFVTWPPEAFAGPADPLRVCVYGADPFGDLIDRAMTGGMSNGRTVAVVRTADPSTLSTCQLVFVAGRTTDPINQVVRATEQRPVLTVGDSSDFLRRGGMIAFVIDGGRVRFDISLQTTSERGLLLSSRLLQVARSIVGKRTPG